MQLGFGVWDIFHQNSNEMWRQQRVKKLFSELVFDIPTLDALDYQLPELETNEEELEFGSALQVSIDILIEQMFIKHSLN